MKKEQLLKDYQLTAINNICNLKRVGLFFTMSAGKTVITLTALKRMLDGGDVKKVLIIAPAAIARVEWHRQAKEWEHTKDLTFSLCIGDKSKREEAIKKEAQIYVISVDNLVWLLRHKRFDFDCMVIDESHTFKSPSSKRFKAIKNYIFDVKSVILLTGTPASNSELDLWSQLFLLDGGKRLGRSFYGFVQKYFYSLDIYGYKLALRKGAKEVIQNRIKDICFSIDVKKEDIRLPEIIYSNEHVTLSHPNKYSYKQFEKKFVLNLEDENISAMTAATLGMKLLQYSNGAIYREDKTYREIHNNKIEKLKEILKTNRRENFLVAYNFIHDRERICNHIKEAVIFDGSAKQIEDWNNRKIKVLLCHPKSAGYGLNLQFGGNKIVWFGLSWSLQDYLQFNARLHRNGQENDVEVIHIVTKDTIDERILKAIENKATSQKQLLEFLKNEYRLS